MLIDETKKPSDQGNTGAEGFLYNKLILFCLHFDF